MHPLEPFPLFEDILSQKAESLSGLSVLLLGEPMNANRLYVRYIYFKKQSSQTKLDLKLITIITMKVGILLSCV